MIKSIPNTKILITGATGYIGSSIIEFLTQHFQYHIIALVRFDNDTKFPYGVEVRQGNFENDNFLINSIADVDVIIHTAGIKGIAGCSNGLSKTINANINFTEKLLGAIKNKNTKIIYTSSYWVYGAQLTPFKEVQVLSPNEMYGWTKAISEKMIMVSGLNYLILRLSNVFGYGAGKKYDEVVSTFVKRVIKGESILLNNAGRHCIDFIDIHDLCCILSQLLSISEKNLVVNIGSGIPMSIEKLAHTINEIVGKVVGKDIKIIYGPQENDTIQFADRYLNISRLLTLIDFTHTPFATSLEKFAYKLSSKDIQ